MFSLKEWVNVFVFHLEDGITSHINSEIHGVHNLMKAACLPTSKGWDHMSGSKGICEL